MSRFATVLLLVGIVITPLGAGDDPAKSYLWLGKGDYDPVQTIVRRIAAPEGFRRVAAGPGTFAHWLRHLPLKPGRPPVLLHNGRKKANQSVHVAVLNIDTGTRNLQQCADAVIRLRAEFLYASGRKNDIHFNFTSGDRAEFHRWARGFRPVVKGNKVRWVRSAAPDDSYRSFRNYLTVVFIYAGTASLEREMRKVEKPRDVRIGDVFIKGGYPGHAVIVIDAAEDRRTGRKVFLLAQSYMPAQDMHVLKNPADARLSPWYDADFGEKLATPEWVFESDQLRRFEDNDQPKERKP